MKQFKSKVKKSVRIADEGQPSGVGFFNNGKQITLVFIEGWATCATIRHVFQLPSAELALTPNSQTFLTHISKKLLATGSSRNWFQIRKKIPCAWPIIHWKKARVYIPDDLPPPDVIDLVQAKLDEESKEVHQGWAWDLYPNADDENESEVLFVPHQDLLPYEITHQAFDATEARNLGVRLRPVYPPLLDDLTQEQSEAERLIATWAKSDAASSYQGLLNKDLETATALALYAMQSAQSDLGRNTSTVAESSYVH